MFLRHGPKSAVGTILEAHYKFSEKWVICLQKKTDFFLKKGHSLSISALTSKTTTLYLDITHFKRNVVNISLVLTKRITHHPTDALSKGTKIRDGTFRDTLSLPVLLKSLKSLIRQEKRRPYISALRVF